jgi:hypothetical protein
MSRNKKPKPPKGKAKPKSPKAKAKPKSPKGKAKPKSPKAKAKPKSPKAKAKPKSPKAKAKPQLPKAKAKPQLPKAKAKPQPPKVKAKPQPPKVKAKPQSPKAKAKPQSPKAKPKPQPPKAKAKQKPATTPVRLSSGQDLVRPSRDGDQFHYHWAARQCLQLLPGATDLVAVTVEGPSTAEDPSNTIYEGEELIDVGLYYGVETRDQARLVRYIQLKHSTRETSKPWTASGLKKTLEGFAERYTELLEHFPLDEIVRRFQFEFTTNRPIDLTVRESLEDLASGAVSRHPNVRKLLLRYSGLTGNRAREFFTVFTATGGEQDLWAQRNLLAQDLSYYLPDADYETPIQLKELVTRKATTEFETDPSIRRHDILRALKTSEEQLSPAPCLLPEAKQTFPREQEQEILQMLLGASTPLVIHADGGIGKSVLAARIAAAMAPGSVAILYDCFGNGLYRNALNFRHRHRDALVQISNELAARGLCHPLIPTAHADTTQYMRAFVGRLTQAVRLLRAADANAKLCLIVDAADNAEMAAEEQGEAGSFVRDLIRTPLPDGVRLAFTCRTHRRDRLRAPPDTLEVELRAFSLAESTRHLYSVYPAASDTDASEFAFLSSFNPRVQALALSQSVSLPEMLKQLGPAPTTVDRAIGNLLEKAIVGLQDRSGEIEAGHIRLICQGLAVLRPLVPIPVLARLSGTSESAVRSFALDLGRPLFLKGNSLHFLDEPTETWFRDRFHPDDSGFTAFLERLRPLTAHSAYAASALPQLLLQVGMLDELVRLALSDDDLPTENPLERRDVRLQRLIFALKACLQRGHYAAAAKLALKAGGECAGEERQNRVIQGHTDVAAILMAPDRIEGLVARRTFPDSWMGSHHAYDAGLLSGRAEYLAEASSHLRMAQDWLAAWARRPKQQRPHDEQVSTEDTAEIAMAMLRLNGAKAAARFLKGWVPRYHTFLAGRLVGRRLIDLGRYDQLEALAEAAGFDTWLLLGLSTEANEIGRLLPVASLARLMRILSYPRLILAEFDTIYEPWMVLDAVRSAVELALCGLPPEPEAWAKVLRRYLPPVPPDSIASRFGVGRPRLLRAYTLEAALRGQQVTLDGVTPDEVRKQQGTGRRTYEGDLFLREAGGLLPWLNLSAEIACGRSPSNVSDAIQQALKEAVAIERHTYQENPTLHQSVVLEWLRILRATADPQSPQSEALSSWIGEQQALLPSDTLITLCRLAARADGFESFALELGAKAYGILESSREDAGVRTDSYLRLARAILIVSQEEAGVYFDRAIEVASRIGDENLERWAALLDIATTAADCDASRPKTAYRLSRIAELTYEYVDRDKHFPWHTTAEVLADLCGSSALAILSRWRDRGFGNIGRLLPVVIDRLIERGKLTRITPVALAGIVADWERAEDLQRALSAEDEVATRAIVTRIAYRYIRVTPSKAEMWTALAELGKRYDLKLPDIERLSAVTSAISTQTREAFPSSRTPDSVQSRRRPNWDELFQAADLSDSAALRSRYQRLQDYDPPYDHEAFFREALARVKAGREPDFIRAVTAWPDFDLFALRDLMRALPSPLSGQLALRSALRETVLSVCRRGPGQIQLRNRYSIIDIEKLCLGGLLSDMEIARAALEGFASQVDQLSASGMFQILHPLASILSPSQAEEALNFGFDLLDEILKPEDGDGEWREELQPHGTVIEALAGYIWVGLGSAGASERWQHAHVVRSIVELGWNELLKAVIAMTDADVSAFVDHRLAFYSWHARQWLLMGLARGALENPAALRPAHAFLQRSLGTEHVMIRELAAQALQTLAAAGEVDIALSDLAGNRPKDVRLYSGFAGEEGEEPPVDPEEASDDSYIFGFDIGPYWFAPLGRAFGLSQQAIERRALAVIKQELGWRGGFGRAKDGRHARKIFEEGETSHRHGSLPRADDVLTYHAYHAMMVVAAALLKERPVQHRTEERTNEFINWMSGYMLTRTDGRWAADRRAPRLIVADNSMSAYERDWCWSVTASYLDQQLTTDDGMRVVWGEWQNGDSDNYETVSVRSALVSVAGAEALLAALQTSSTFDRLALPLTAEKVLQPEEALRDGKEQEDGDDSDSRGNVNAGPLRLAGWLSHQRMEPRLDEYDPWGEGVVFPGPAPSRAIISRLGLRQSEDGNVWVTDSSGSVRAELWAHIQRSGRHQETIAGERLSINAPLLQELLAAYPDYRMIISVEMRRHASRGHLDVSDDYPLPYLRYYLMGADGVTTTL